MLSKIKPEHAARVLGALPEEFALEVVQRMLRMESVQKDILDKVEQTLRVEFMSNLARTAKRDSHEQMAEIFNNFDRQTESRFITALEERSRDSAERIKALMFTFEDLGKLDPGSIQTLLRHVEKDKLGLALKGATDALRDIFFSNMSERAGKILREDMEAMGPVRLKDVDEAQMRMVNVAKDLANKGEIMIASKQRRRRADVLMSTRTRRKFTFDTEFRAERRRRLRRRARAPEEDPDARARSTRSAPRARSRRRQGRPGARRRKPSPPASTTLAIALRAALRPQPCRDRDGARRSRRHRACRRQASSRPPRSPPCPQAMSKRRCARPCIRPSASRASCCAPRPASPTRWQPRIAEIAHEEGYDGRVHDRRRSRASPAPIAASNGAAAAPSAAKPPSKQRIDELDRAPFLHIRHAVERISHGRQRRCRSARSRPRSAPQSRRRALLNSDAAPEADVKRSATDLEAVFDVPVTVSAVLGKSAMEVSQLLKLGKGTVVELDRKVGEAIDIYVNNRLVARGEVVLVEDRLGVTMTEIIKAGPVLEPTRRKRTMRLLIVGGLQGQIGAATKIAMDRGAKVTHAGDIEQALASSARRQRRRPGVLRRRRSTSARWCAASPPSASARRSWPAASAPTRAAPWTRSAPAPRNICRCRPIPN